MNIKLPGRGITEIKNLVFDFNGTLADNGKLSQSGKDVLKHLSKNYKLYVATSDTFGTASEELKDFDVNIVNVKSGSEKLELIMKLGYTSTIAVGNGNNDIGMLKKSVVGIGIIGSDGASPNTLNAADIVVCDIAKIIPLLTERDLLFSILRK